MGVSAFALCRAYLSEGGLVQQDCGGDYAPYEVAQVVADWQLNHTELSAGEDTPLNKMFAYLALIPNAEERGFECSVNEDDVWAWLKGDIA